MEKGGGKASSFRIFSFRYHIFTHQILIEPDGIAFSTFSYMNDIQGGENSVVYFEYYK